MEKKYTTKTRGWETFVDGSSVVKSTCIIKWPRVAIALLQFPLCDLSITKHSHT